MNNPKIALIPALPNTNNAMSNATQPTTQQILVPIDSDIIIRARNKEDFGVFQAISPLRTKELDSPDLFDIFGSLPRSAIKVFNQVKLKRNDKNSLCHHPTDKMSKSDCEMFNRGIRLLIVKKLIKRVPVSSNIVSVRKGTYMINPLMIKCWDYASACRMWSQLK